MNTDFYKRKMGILIFCFCSFLLVGCDAVDLWPHEAFESKKWLKADIGERYRYVKDLFLSKKIDGLSKRQIVELLGEPESDSIGNMSYLVKEHGSFFDPNMYIIVLRFDENDNCKGYFVRSL